MHKSKKQILEAEVERCARAMYHELTQGRPHGEGWYVLYLCERHGGFPLLDPQMPKGQIAYWDGEDIVVDPTVDANEIISALPEELAHRLSSAETSRFEALNDSLKHLPTVSRYDFQERVGQRVAQLFDMGRASV